jgi:hypothetical protein
MFPVALLVKQNDQTTNESNPQGYQEKVKARNVLTDTIPAQKIQWIKSSGKIY